MLECAGALEHDDAEALGAPIIPPTGLEENKLAGMDELASKAQGAPARFEGQRLG